MSSNSNSDDENNSSFISEPKNNEPINAFEFDENMSDKKVHENFVKNVLVDKVSKYIKLDNIIKEKQEKLKAELKKIKDAKEVMEEYIITYLDKNDADFLNIGKEKLRVEEKKSQSAIKMEYIEECLVDGFKKYELYENENEISKVVKEFLETINSKRKITTRKVLVREDKDKKEKVVKPKKEATNNDKKKTKN